MWSEEDPAWWSKGKKGKKGLSKGNDGFQKGGFRPYQPDKGTDERLSPEQRCRKRTQKGKDKEGTYPQSGFSASETFNDEGHGHAWESDDWSVSPWTGDSWTPDAKWFCTKAHTAWMVATPLNLANHPTRVVLDVGCTRSIGSRAAIGRSKKHAWYYGITTEFCRCIKSVVFSNCETQSCMEGFTLHFPTAPPCSTKVHVFETGDVPILFSLVTNELDPKKGDKITCPAFGLYSSPAEHSTTMEHIVLDSTNLAYQPTTKSRGQPGHPKRRVTVPCQSEN